MITKNSQYVACLLIWLMFFTYGIGVKLMFGRFKATLLWLSQFKLVFQSLLEFLTCAKSHLNPVKTCFVLSTLYSPILLFPLNASLYDAHTSCFVGEAFKTT